MTSKPDTKGLRALATRVEQAMGADRDLDAEVCRLAKLSQEQPDGSWMTYFDGGYRHSIDPPCVTSSLDAAMTLRPIGCGVMLFQFGDCGTGEAQVGNMRTKAATPALALTAASLRALATLVEEKGE